MVMICGCVSLLIVERNGERSRTSREAETNLLDRVGVAGSLSPHRSSPQLILPVIIDSFFVVDTTSREDYVESLQGRASAESIHCG
jgi:hypothetical protein